MPESQVLSGWQRKIIDQVTPAVQQFAESRRGTVHAAGQEITARVFTGGYTTIQVVVRGKSDDCKLEVTGVKRSGIETHRTVFSLNPPDYAVELPSLLKALDQASYN